MAKAKRALGAVQGAAVVKPDVWTVDKLDAPSVDNAAMSPYWDQVACIVAGTDAMRKAGKTYLPQFPNEANANYLHRKNNSKFTNIYRDILEGLSSKPFEEPVKLDDGTSSQLKDFCTDVDGGGNDITAFSLQSFFMGINDAVTFIFIDYEAIEANPDERPRSVADEQAAGLRPYWTRITAKNMLEVRTAVVGGKKVLTYCRILEPSNGSTPLQVRILERFGDAVTWSLWRYEKNPANGRFQWHQVAVGTITIGVIPIVPFITGRQNGNDWQFFPPMRDAADLQIELYQAESGLKNVRTLSGFPMLSGNGISPDLEADNKTPKRLATGPSTVLYGPPNPGGGAPGNWAYVEPSADVMTFLSADVKATIDQLRELGRQPLTAQSGNLTTITAGVAASKANSAVASWALSLARSLTECLIVTALWFGDATSKPKVTVFTDFDIVGNPDDLAQLTAARGAGDLSQRTYWEELVRRGILPADFDADAEEKLLLAEAPADTGEGDGNPNDPNNLPNGGKPVPGKPVPKAGA